jgi:fibro-slime domain-containing protein
MAQRVFSTCSVPLVLAFLAWGCGESKGTGGTEFNNSSSSVTVESDAASSEMLPNFDSDAGVGFDLGDSGSFVMDSGEGGSSVLTLTIRDFKMWDAGDPTTNPDFENRMGDDRGIVMTTLGSDGKPVYANTTGTTRTTHGQADFDQWYNDVPGVNINVQYPIALTQSTGGVFGYDSRVSGVPLSAAKPTNEFFPIDDGTPYATVFGNQGKPHNYSFTTELHTVFTYGGGETFSFSGDDDVFVFIDGALVIDLGGIHNREQASVSLDSLGLTKGVQYPLDLFGAERHTTESNVSFQTTLQLSPPPPK